MWLSIIFEGSLLALFVGQLILIILGIRANARGRAYLRRLPPVNGIPLDIFGYVGWSGPVWQAYHHKQDNAELERLRQEAWRTMRQVRLWAFGIMSICFCFAVLALLIITGYAE